MMALQGLPPPSQLCNRCYICGQGIEWGKRVFHCLQCDFTICASCRPCDRMHSSSIISVQFEPYSATAEQYKPTSTCSYCKNSFRARWECRFCKFSACCGCIYDNNRTTRFVTGHLATHRGHTEYVAILPPGWAHTIRPDAPVPHPQCVDMSPDVYSHCSRCLSVITFNSWTYQCNTCAVEYGTSQRICSTCYQDASERHDHVYSRLVYQLFSAPQPADKQIRLFCEKCPDLANKPWNSKLIIEHPHSDLILRMTKERADYTRLGRYKRCARAKRPLLRLSSPRAICSVCHRFLEYWSDVVVCLKSGCNTSICPACVDEGIAAAHEHQATVVHLRLLQTAAVASLGLSAEPTRKLYLATSRHIITCTSCSKRDSLIYFEGIFCMNCKSRGRCITCLTTRSSTSAPWCQCLKPTACFNFGLRSDQIFATRVPKEDEKTPGFTASSALRPSMLKYEKLPTSVKQPVRLLYLQPEKGTQEITISLKVHSLSSCPEYEALSYTWGSGENPTIIKSSTGETLLATANLAHAFFRLRYPDKPRVLWVDAICINQDDRDEVALQVSNMANVYSQATQVLIWLGEAANNSVRAFAWIREEPARQKLLVDQMRRILQVRPDFLEHVKRLGGNHPEVSKVFQAMKWMDIPSQVIPPMLDLMKRPYFLRVWVIQETFYARSMQVLCGPDVIDWDTFVGACHTFWHSKELRDEYPHVHGTFIGPQTLGNLRGKREVSSSEALDFMLSDYSGPTKTILKTTARMLQLSSMSFGEASSKIFNFAKHKAGNIVKPDQQPQRPFRDLLTVLIAFWDYHATDPRDKVFALLGLVKAHGVSINYDQRISELFKDVAFSIIAQHQNIELFTIANCARETACRLPSWAPDWSDFDSESAALQLNQNYRLSSFEAPYMKKYTASKGSKLRNPIRNGNILTLSGYLVDGFARVGPKMPFFEDKHISGKLDTIIDCLLAWDEIAMTPSAVPGGQPTGAIQQAETVFCLTLSRGTFWVGSGDANKTMLDFRRWRAALTFLRSPMAPAQQTAARAQFLEDEQFEIANVALLSWHNYTIARTKSGLLVMGLGVIEETDHIALMRGCDLPLIVRAHPSIPGQFRLVGSAYVHGIMHGEWWNESRCQRMDFN